MTQEEINEAIEQMKNHCDTKMPNYEPVSARSALYELGYSDVQTEEVLQNIHDRGFTNCLDYRFKTSSYPDFVPRYPTQDVCYWGPDQLKSRLWALR